MNSEVGKKYKKVQISKSMRVAVWNKYIGENIGKTKCTCCRQYYITQLNFECGHVIAESLGGETEIYNLRPICTVCNKSMGTNNLEKFKTKINPKSKILNEIINKYNIKEILQFEKLINSGEFSTFDICKYIKELAGNKFIYKKVGSNVYKLYCFNGLYWDDDVIPLMQFISGDLYDFLKTILFEVYWDSKEFSSMKTKLNKLKNVKYKEEIVKTYKEYGLNDDIEFDNKWWLFGFKNKVYDLEKHEFREYRMDDYISITTGYNWIEPTNEQLKTMNNLIDKIMPIKEERELYLQILSTGLEGKCTEKFIIFNGSGGNGKGMINDIMLLAVGKYGMIANNSILFEKNKTGANPEKANLHQKRLVIAREPSENSKFENAVVKELTGGGKFSSRGLHENETEKKLALTLIVECNKKPLFAEEITQGDARRIIDIYFRSTFTDDEKMWNDDIYIYPIDTKLKTEQFQNDHKCALLYILFKEHEKLMKNDGKLPITESIKERTNSYLELSCQIVSWFKDNYICTESKEDIIKIKDIYENFSNSDYFVNLTKVEKRKYNKKYFIDYFSENIFLKKYYCEKYCNATNFLRYWKKKVEDN